MRFTITGHSMEPTLKEGDRVWASFFLRKPRKGEIVVLHHHKTLLVKRIAKDLGNERYEVEGDNANDSFDSRTLGTVSRKKIVAKVYLRYQPLSKTGWFNSTKLRG